VRITTGLASRRHLFPELSLIALSGDLILGHILFTKLIIRNKTGEVFHTLSLAPMAVAEELQNRSIGSQLINTGLKKAKELGYESMIVLGHSHYYPRFGFKPASQWVIMATYEVPDNAFMALELEPDALAGVAGTVEYPKEFESV